MALAIGADIHLIYVFQIPVTASEVPMPEPVYEEMLDNGLELQGKQMDAATNWGLKPGD